MPRDPQPIVTDASRRAAWDLLWRKLLSAPPLAADLADALERAEGIPAPETDGRSPCATETSGRPQPAFHAADGAHDNTAIPSREEGVTDDTP